MAAAGKIDTSKYIIIDGLPPNVTLEKCDLFKKQLAKKMLEKLGHERFFLHLITDLSAGLAIGAFVKFFSSVDAEKALALLNKFKFTRLDMLTTYRWEELEECATPLGPYEPPEFGDTNLGEDVHNTMMDDVLARPQLILKSGLQYDVEWSTFDNVLGKFDAIAVAPAASSSSAAAAASDKKPLAHLAEYDRKSKKLLPGIVTGTTNNPKPFPIWSPYGTLLISQHATGLKFWGGKNLDPLFEVSEPDIKSFQISPLETYMVVRKSKDITVWNIKESRQLKTITGMDTDSAVILKYNADDTLVAAWVPVKDVVDAQNKVIGSTPGTMTIYHAATMKHIRGTTEAVRSYTFELPDLLDFEWNPNRPQQMSMVHRGDAQIGWKVTVDRIVIEEGETEKDRLAVLLTDFRRNVVAVSEIRLLWHPFGGLLAAKTVKEVQGTSLVEYILFRVFEASCAADHFKLETNIQPMRFNWCPTGQSFAVTVADTSVKVMGAYKVALRIYTIEKVGLKLRGSFPTSGDTILWASKGSRLVSINFDKSTLEFYLLNDANKVATLLEKAEHPAITDAQWDPSGRFLCTWTSSLRHPGDSRLLRVFDMNGRKLQEARLDRLSHLAWRPVAKGVLSESRLQKIRLALPHISAQYKAEDDRREQLKAKAELDVRTALEAKYIKTMNEIAADAAKRQLKEQREALRDMAASRKRQQTQLAKLPEEQRTIVEVVIEEKGQTPQYLKDGEK